MAKSKKKRAQLNVKTAGKAQPVAYARVKEFLAMFTAKA